MIKEKEKQNNYDAAIRLLAVMVRQYIEKHKDEPRSKGDDKQAA